MPSYLAHMPHVLEDTSIVSVHMSFFDTFHTSVSSAQHLHPRVVDDPLPSDSNNICDDNLFHSVAYMDDMLLTYALPRSPSPSRAPSSHDDSDDCPSFVSDLDDDSSIFYDVDLLHVSLRAWARSLPLRMASSHSGPQSPSSSWPSSSRTSRACRLPPHSPPLVTTPLIIKFTSGEPKYGKTGGFSCAGDSTWRSLRDWAFADAPMSPISEIAGHIASVGGIEFGHAVFCKFTVAGRLREESIVHSVVLS
jgi:hypothetical protein